MCDVVPNPIIDEKKNEKFFYFISKCLADTTTAEAMVIGVLEAVVKVIGTKLGMEEIEKSKVKVLLDPLKKACKKPEFSFWGALLILPIIFNGLHEGGKESFEFFVRMMFHRTTYI